MMNTRRLLNVMTSLAASLLLSTLAVAQSRQVPGAPQQAPVVIHSATIHTVNNGTIEHGYIVLANGLIEDLGEGDAPTIDGAVVHDASGMHVYPGLISAASMIGLTETGAVDVTHDHTETGRVKPEVRAVVAVNPDSDIIPVTRANGILTTLVFPQGGLVSGRCSSIRLDGWTWEDMAIDAYAGLVISWPRTDPVSAWWMNESVEDQRRNIARDLEAVETVFDDAIAYVRAKDNDPTVATDLRYEAMRPVLNREKPIYIKAASVSQIESAVAWAQRRGLDIIIVGGNQADGAIPVLKAYDIPIIIGGTHRTPGRRHDDFDQPFTLPATLHDAGIRFCIATGNGSGAAHERNLNHQAATAAAYGLDPEAALRAVTQWAAEIIGLGDTHGTLTPGKAGTIIVTTGDPLEIIEDTLVAYIDGRRVDLGSRHKSLHEKYREKYRQLGLLD